MHIQHYTNTPAWADIYKSKAKPALFPIDIKPQIPSFSIKAK